MWPLKDGTETEGHRDDDTGRHHGPGILGYVTHDLPSLPDATAIADGLRDLFRKLVPEDFPDPIYAIMG